VSGPGTRLNLVLALPAEARAVNRILDLQRVQPDPGLPVYAGDGISLVVTGPGLAAVRRGVRFLQRVQESTGSGWLNIGIAGHPDLPLGQALIASRVIGPQAGQDYRLSPLAGTACRPVPVCTVNRPENDYPKPWAYDMEAAGFVAAALESTPPAGIQVLKIVSDNRRRPSGMVNGRMAVELILQHAALIRQIVERMKNP